VPSEEVFTARTKELTALVSYSKSPGPTGGVGGGGVFLPRQPSDVAPFPRQPSDGVARSVSSLSSVGSLDGSTISRQSSEALVIGGGLRLLRQPSDTSHLPRQHSDGVVQSAIAGQGPLLSRHPSDSSQGGAGDGTHPGAMVAGPVAGPGLFKFAALCGPDGVGKSALAREFCRVVQARKQ
jgi:hypothetical protein